MSTPKRILIFVLMALCLPCLTSCRSYAVIIKNDSGMLLAESTVTYGRFRSVGGFLKPGTAARHAFVQDPIPEFATIQFRAPDGVLHHEQVRMKSHAPVGVRHGNFIFTIDESLSVSLDYKTKEQTMKEAQQAYAEYMRSNY